MIYQSFNADDCGTVTDSKQLCHTNVHIFVVCISDLKYVILYLDMNVVKDNILCIQMSICRYGNNHLILRGMKHRGQMSFFLYLYTCTYIPTRVRTRQ